LVKVISGRDYIVPVTAEFAGTFAIGGVDRRYTCVYIFEKIVRARTDASACE
jgi:hypothetical protein